MYDLLSSLYQKFTASFTPKEHSLLLLGLDNAGKTTLLRMLRDNKVRAEMPTTHAQKQRVEIEGIIFMVYDLGGHESVRRLWHNYSMMVGAIIFIFDASDESRYDEAKDELNDLLHDPRLLDRPLVVLVNKVDLITGGVNEEEYANILGVGNLRYGLSVSQSDHTREYFDDNGQERSRLIMKNGRRPIELFLTSIAKGAGYRQAFEWLVQFFY